MASKAKPARRPAPASKPKPRPPARKAPVKKPVARAPAKSPSKPAPKAPAKPSAKPSVKTSAKAPAKPPAKVSSKKPAPAPEEPGAIPLRGDGRRHLLSLSFLRDGDEFLARLETDGGQITELKNRALDQLLTLVASEL